MSIEMRLIERVADSPNKDLPTVEVAQAALRVINDLQSALSEARAEVERLKRERDDLARREKASLSAAQCFDGSLPSTERFEGVIRQALVAQDQRLGAAERDCRDARAERDELRAEVERLRGGAGTSAHPPSSLGPAPGSDSAARGPVRLLLPRPHGTRARRGRPGDAARRPHPEGRGEGGGPLEVPLLSAPAAPRTVHQAQRRHGLRLRLLRSDAGSARLPDGR